VVIQALLNYFLYVRIFLAMHFIEHCFLYIEAAQNSHLKINRRAVKAGVKLGLNLRTIFFIFFFKFRTVAFLLDFSFKN